VSSEYRPKSAGGVLLFARDVAAVISDRESLARPSPPAACVAFRGTPSLPPGPRTTLVKVASGVLLSEERRVGTSDRDNLARTSPLAACCFPAARSSFRAAKFARGVLLSSGAVACRPERASRSKVRSRRVAFQRRVVASARQSPHAACCFLTRRVASRGQVRTRRVAFSRGA
jgi:hypothetical protein